MFQWPKQTAAGAKIIHTDRYNGATSGYFCKVEKKLAHARRRMRGLQLIAGGDRFLDVGCNGGFMVQAAAERGYEAHGVDIDPVSIAYAQRTYSAGRFHAGTLDQLPLDVGRFDLVHCSEVIEHVPDSRAFISAFARSLRSGGCLYLTTPDIHHWSQPRDRRRIQAFNDPGHCVFYSRRALRRTFRALGIDHVLTLPNLKPGIRMILRKAL